MVNSVTFDPAVGGDGSTVTDDDNPLYGLDDDGHRLRFVPSLKNIVAIAQWLKANIYDQAANVLGGANAVSSSVTPISIPAIGATVVFTILAGKGYIGGQKVVAARPPPNATTAIYGRVSDYTGTQLSIIVDEVTGAGGPYTAWNIAPSPYGVPAGRSVTGSGVATGGGDFTANRVIDVARAQAAAVRTGTTTAQVMTPGDTYAGLAEVVLTDAATVTPDFGGLVNFALTATAGVGGTRQLGNPINAKSGQTGYGRYIQDATGSRGLTFGSKWKREGGAATASTTGNAEDNISFVVKANGDIWYSYARAPS